MRERTRERWREKREKRERNGDEQGGNERLGKKAHLLNENENVRKTFFKKNRSTPPTA